ncbi:MAG TPA: SRPBCC family protein [Anaeromyxobacter sp.]|nr:SRPBCC family protein [Anaeromyxobacter sp.]
MTTNTAQVNAVRKSLTVAAPQEVAFRVFTEKMTSWWPLETHHLGAVKAVAAVIEPRAGGRWFERGEDGSETPWGSVVTWDPPRRVVLTWDISADFRCEPNLGTEVEVRFVAEGPRATRVEFEHRHLDRFGPRADEMRAIFDSPGGWTGLLERFAGAVAG